MVFVIVPVYALKWGWRNFLWFSDIALFGTVIALWLESALIASMMAVGVLLPELVWTASFLGRLIFGVRASDLAAYMFDPSKPRYLRALSLFHLVLPVTLLWLIWRLGYDGRALPAQILLAWVVLPLSFWVVRPQDENINWVRGLGEGRKAILPPLLHLALLLLGFPLVIFAPTHIALKLLFSAA